VEDLDVDIGLAKEVCPVCCKEEDGPILIGKKLVRKGSIGPAEKVHKQVIGFMPEPCAECQEHMKMGVVVITIDESKSDFTNDPNNPYRTGGHFVMSDQWVERVFDEAGAHALEKRVMFLEHEAAEQLGLFESLKDAEDVERT